MRIKEKYLGKEFLLDSNSNSIYIIALNEL